jgi:L-threonylcarbamoyladenylate synthase
VTLLLNPEDIPAAAALLRAGRLVAFPTETVYGLGADATNAEAVAAVFEAKGRPRFNPLICHFSDPDQVFGEVVATPLARRLAARFWPGPLTLVLPRQPVSRIAALATAGLDTLAVRIPAHPVARELIAAVGRPLAAPSANRSGRVSPTRAKHVLAELEECVAAVIESGPCAVGVESTVLDLSGGVPVLLRPGGVSLEALEVELGPISRGDSHGAGGAPRSPGLLLSHYAPRLPLRLGATAAAADEALLAFGPPPPARLTFQLSEAGDVVEAATRLFEGLHWLDAAAPQQGLARIAVMPVPETGLGLAINDRLRRAAGKE